MIPPDDPLFEKPWQAQAFAMAVNLNARGLFTWTEWAAALADEIAAAPNRGYHESWLAALEKLVEARQLMSRGERLARIDAWDRAARATPHGRAIELHHDYPGQGHAGEDRPPIGAASGGSMP